MRKRAFCASHRAVKRRNTFFEKQQREDYRMAGWGEASELYERSFGNKFRAYAKEALNFVKDRSRIIDVGCGSGALFDVLKQNENVESYLGVDFSEEMIDICNSKKNQSVDDINASFRVANGENLSVDENSKDLAVALFSVIFFPRRDRGLSEMYRVLDQNGLALVSGWSTVKKLEWVYYSNLSMKRVLSSETFEPERLALKDMTSQATNQKPNFLAWSNPADLKREMQDVNFRNVRTFERTERFLMPCKNSCACLWKDMASSFPTIKYLLESLYRHKIMTDAFPNHKKEERKIEFETSISKTFSELIGERGCPPEHDGGEEAYGYLDGKAIFGIGEK